jgi:hypothetical protein
LGLTPIAPSRYAHAMLAARVSTGMLVALPGKLLYPEQSLLGTGLGLYWNIGQKW